MAQNGIICEKIIRRRGDGELEYISDDLTAEAPLEIRIGRKPVATTMRTPGHDEELAAGFLVSEALIASRRDLRKVRQIGDNVITVDLDPALRPILDAARRFGTISTSCGLCGKTTIAAIQQHFGPIQASDLRVGLTTLLSLPHRLREQQGEFSRTGGIHGAGIFDLRRETMLVREDIGRHNAVDKTIGRALLDGLLPLDKHVLVVSGRASLEIVQKALGAGIPIIASVSAPSTLAVSFARSANQTLIAFLRPPSFNIYAHVERVRLDSG